MLKISLYITIFLLSLGQLVSLSKGGGFNLYAFDFGVGFFSIFGLIIFLLVKKSFKIPRYSYLFIFFTLIALSSLVLASNDLPEGKFLVSGFYLIRVALYLLAGLIVFNIVDKKILTFNDLCNVFIYSGLFLALGGFIQLVFLPDFTTLDPGLGWDPHKNRLASTFFDPNFLGAYFVLCLVILLERFYPSRINKKEGWKKAGKFEVVSFAVLLIALILTFSRSAWGMFGIAVLIYGLFRSRLLLYGSILVVFLAYFAVPRIQTRVSGITDPADSAAFRLVSWGNTLKIIKDNFWFGVGFNSFRYVQREYGFLTLDNEESHSGAGSDSSLLFVFATTGIFGFIIFSAGLILPLYECFVRKYSGWLMVSVMILGLLMESQFINSIFYPQIMFFVFAVLFSFPSRT